MSTGFVHHNIVLPDGSETLASQPLLEQTAAARGALALATRVCPPGPTRRVVDLGCLDGGYAVMFARAGYDVIGIDARRSNIARCERVREALGLENLRFVVDDARNIRDHGRFDVVCCFGLLYHLDSPVEYLRVLAALTGKLLLLHGHHAPLDDDARAVANYHLSAISEHEGVKGRWYSEPHFSSEQARESSSLSAWGNERSFWICKDELEHVLSEAGFAEVREEFDSESDAFGGFAAIKHRQRAT